MGGGREHRKKDCAVNHAAKPRTASITVNGSAMRRLGMR